MYSRYCFMCSSKQPRRGRADCSFHKFPSAPEIRSQWLRLCKLTDADDVSNLRLCSKHFTPQDFVNFVEKKFGGYFKLKPGAVPTIRRPLQQQAKRSSSSNSSTSVTACSSTTSEPFLNETVESISQGVHSIDNTTVVIERVTASCSREASTQTDTVPFILEETSPINEEMGQALETESSTLKRRRFAEPRFLGDIKTEDVATPRRAKRTLRLAVETAQKHSKKVRTLQEQVRYIKKNLHSLKNLIRQLREKNLISESAAESLIYVTK